MWLGSPRRAQIWACWLARILKTVLQEFSGIENEGGVLNQYGKFRMPRIFWLVFPANQKWTILLSVKPPKVIEWSMLIFSILFTVQHSRKEAKPNFLMSVVIQVQTCQNLGKIMRRAPLEFLYDLIVLKIA